MPVKTEDEAKAAADSAIKKEGEGAQGQTAGDKGAGEKAGGDKAATPGIDAAFKSLITSLLRQQLNMILPELRELKAAATSAAVAGATSAGSGGASGSSSIAALLGETGSGTSAAAASTPGVSDELLRSIKTQLEKLEKQFGTSPSGSGGNGGGNEDLVKMLDELIKGQSSLGKQVVEQVVQHIQKDLITIAKHVVDFRSTVDARLTRMEESVRGAGVAAAQAAVAAPVAVQVRPQPAQQSYAPVEADEDEWKEVILGEELCRDPSLSEARTRLFRGVLNGDSASKALAGQMMLAQAASVDRFPPLMKEVGEAYYRWRPKTAGVSDPFETALAAWLKRRCDAEGLGNTIELVIVGDRFDATRHNASDRGAEITAVHGWVVLRDNGKVYTKANVSVK